MKGDFVKRTAEQQDHYEGIIQSLSSQLRSLQSDAVPTPSNNVSLSCLLQSTISPWVEDINSSFFFLMCVGFIRVGWLPLVLQRGRH